jgi:energy coupling factor transporter S component ThiW
MSEIKKAGKSDLRKMVLCGMLAAVAVACSGLYIPIGAAKCFPVQHAVDLVAAVLFGPWYAVGVAFVSSVLRLCLGTGTLLAFPGSMIGAFLSGFLFYKTKSLLAAYAGEIAGTGILGALAAYPLASAVLGKDAAFYGYIVPFIISSAGGASLGMVLVLALRKTKVLNLEKR